MSIAVSPSVRNVLLEHIDGAGVLWTRNMAAIAPGQRHGVSARSRTLISLIARGWVKVDKREYPTRTYITDAGREALAKALADWADALEESGLAEINWREMHNMHAIFRTLRANFAP